MTLYAHPEHFSSNLSIRDSANWYYYIRKVEHSTSPRAIIVHHSLYDPKTNRRSPKVLRTVFFR